MDDRNTLQRGRRIGAWPGGTVSAVHFAGNRLLAASRAGLLRSDDEGASWQRSDTGLYDPSVLALAATDDGSRLFAAGESGRLYHSTDGGMTWNEVTGWAGLGLITALALSPEYAQDNTIFAATPAGPFRSHDGGASWEIAIFGLVDVEVLCIAVDPHFAHSELLWIGTANGGLYRSRNGGRSWRDAGSGLPDVAVQSLLALTEAEQTILFAGVEDEGIFRSEDGGSSWRQALAGVGVNCLAAAQAGRLLAGSDDGILLSEDQGANWCSAEGGHYIALGLAVSAAGRAAAATWQEAVTVSADGGRSWHKAAIPALHAPPMALRTQSGEFFAADLDGGWAVSTDQAASWQPVDVMLEAPVSTLVGGGRDDTVMAGSGTSLFRRAGAEWEELELSRPIFHLALSPHYPQDRTLLFAADDGTLHRSNDDGTTWQVITPPWAGRTLIGCQFSPRYQADQSIYAVTVQARDKTNSVEVWQSADGGTTWVDLAEFGSAASAIPFLAVDNAHHSIFLADDHRVIHLYISSTNGALAAAQEALPANVRVTALVAAPGGTVYAASNHGVYRRSDAGEWNPCVAGMEDEIVVALLPASGGPGVRRLALRRHPGRYVVGTLGFGRVQGVFFDVAIHDS